MSVPPHPSTSLYVGDLAPEVSESFLLEIFKQAGPLASIRVCRDTITRRSLGYAYVNYNNAADAEKALDSLNGMSIKGKPCRVMWVQRDPSLRKSGVGNIFIKNLDKSIDHKQLYDTFSLFGKILSCKVALDAKNESKGFGFVHFERAEDAQKAIKTVNGKEVVGKIVYVAPFIPRKSRSSAGSKDTFTNVYFKNFPETWTLEVLNGIFSKFGELKNLHLSVSDDGKRKGFGFANYANHEDAVKAVENLHDKPHSDFNDKGEPIASTPAVKEEVKEGTAKDEAVVKEEKDAAASDSDAKAKEEAKEEEKKDETKRLYVSRFQKKSERMRKYKEKWRVTNLYIKNIEDGVDEKRLLTEFSPFGTITSHTIMRDEKGTSKGFGFVCFSTPEEAERAVNEMNGKMLGSKPLYVALAQRREERKLQLELNHSRKSRGIPGPHMFQGPPNFLYPSQYFGQVMRRGAGWPPSAGVAGYPYVVPPPGRMIPRGRGPAAPAPAPTGAPVPAPAALAPAPATTVPVPATVPPAAAAPVAGADKLDLATLQSYAPDTRTQILGERLYPLIQAQCPERPGKITGMLLERYKDELGALLDLLAQPEKLAVKVNEAVQVLKTHYAEGEPTA